MKEVYIVDAKRTAVGSFLGSLSSMHPANFGAEIVKNLIESNKINPNDIEEVICGNVLSAGLGQGIGRQIQIKAGINEKNIGYSVNMICGSGMKSLMIGYSQIASGLSNLIVAGGSESMSMAPYLNQSQRTGSKLGDIKIYDHILKDALTDSFNNIHMGETAENIASKYEISRTDQDEFAYNSQLKAMKAMNDNKFSDEIVPIAIKKRREEIVFDKDEYVNLTTNEEKLAKLRPAFIKDGTVTAGNSSGINDGASFLLLASKEYVEQNNLKPLAKIIAVGQGGVCPTIMGLGPVAAIDDLLKESDIKIEDIELFELNEAFAAQSIGVLKEIKDKYNIDISSKTNVNGGAISIGHPVGASGARITTTLVHEMVKSNAKYGVASLCIGGGMGVALLIERV
ncbi:MAG: acetyl-CoA C-acetyltransferase [Bacilli bacterium]